MENPIRVLQVFHGMDCGGAENMIMNLYRKIDRTKVQFDFLVHTEKKCFFDDEIESLGGQIFHVPYYHVTNQFAYQKALREFFSGHPEIKIVHGHLGSCAHIYLKVAKEYGCFTIAHSHNTLPTDRSIKNMLYRIFTLKTRQTADYFMACGKQAGIDRFGKDIVASNRFQVLNNAIDTQKYIFNPEKRKTMRKQLNLEDNFVLGHIGRFNYQKNHDFLLDIFYEVQKKMPSAKLLLVGDGDLRPKIQEKIDRLGISDKVIMTGIRKDVPDLLQAMDCFVFPSHYEGLPVTVIETQAAGLSCCISDKITKEVEITDLVSFLSIDNTAQTLVSWINTIESTSLNTGRRNTKQEIIDFGYDIETSATLLTNFYLSKIYG